MDALQAMRFLNTISATAKATTRNNYRNNLKTLFGWLCKFYKARYTDNPFADAGTVPETRKTKEWYRPGQVAELSAAIAASDPQLHLAVQVMFNCFARPNELRQLRICNIVWETRRLQIESYFAKVKITRHIPIPDCLLQQFEVYRYLPGQWFLFGNNGAPGEDITSRDNLSKRHKAFLQDLDYKPGFCFYSWKNTGAVKMLMQDKKNLRYISKCMGHHSLDMTDKYFESLGVDEMGETIVFPELSEPMAHMV